jgi:hypothetical protein
MPFPQEVRRLWVFASALLVISGGLGEPASARSSSATSQQKLVANPASISFGSVQVSSTKTSTETLTNSANSKLTISQATVTGTGFGFTGLSLPLTLTPGQSFTLKVTFTPKSASSVRGSISFISKLSNLTITVPLSGSGVSGGQLGISPTSLSFGSVAVGTSKTMSATLTASGSSVTISSATLNSSEFKFSGMSFPYTLAAGRSASFSVGFLPQTSGTTTGSLSFSSNASTGSSVEALTGTGTTSAQHRVTLSWKSSTSLVVGYNIYRSSKSGGPYTRLNSVIDASTTYVDGSVQNGQNYYYVTTDVNSSGMESVYSNQVQVTIPSS